MSLSRSDFVPPLVVRLKAWLLRDLFRKGSTGLNKLDLWLIEAIAPRSGGFFVELGANDGIRQSNTYKL